MPNYKQKTHCKYGHELTPDNVRQTYKNGRKDGRKCVTCEKEGLKNYRNLNPEKINTIRTNSAIKTKYGLDGIEGRDKLLKAQGGKCALCERSDCHWGKGFNNVWHIDHDHVTGEVRGILCAPCNTFIGQVEKNTDLLGKVYTYTGRDQYGSIGSSTFSWL